MNIKKKLNNLLAEMTGQPVKKIAEDTDRNYFMHAAEAKEYGIVDNILEKRQENGKKEE